MIGYATTAPVPDTMRLYRAYCRDKQHYFYLEKPPGAHDIERIEAFVIYVWTKSGDGRVPIHACFLPDDKDAFFDSDLEAVRDYAEMIQRAKKIKPKVIERMFYLYPPKDSDAPPKHPLTVIGTPAADLPRLQVKTSIPVPKTYILAATPEGKVTLSGGLFSGVSIVGRTRNNMETSGLPCQGTTEKMLVVSSNGRYIAASGTAGGMGGIIHVWDIKAEAEIASPSLVGSQRIGAAFSPDGKTLYYSGESEKDVKIWDTTTRKVTGSLSHPKVTHMAMTPDGKVLATCDEIEVRVWNLAEGKVIASTPSDPEGNMGSVAITPDGKTVVIGTKIGHIQIWDVGATRPRVKIRAYSGTPCWVESLAMSPDGRFVVSAGSNLSAGIWDVATGKGLASAQIEGESSVPSVSITDGGKTLLTASPGKFRAPPGSWTGGIRVWDLSSVAAGLK